VQFQQGHVLDHIVLVLQLPVGPTLHGGICTGRSNLAKMGGEPGCKVVVKIQLRQPIEPLALDSLLDHAVVLATVHEHLIQRITGGVRVHIVRAHLLHKSDYRCHIPDLQLINS